MGIFLNVPSKRESKAQHFGIFPDKFSLCWRKQETRASGGACCVPSEQSSLAVLHVVQLQDNRTTRLTRTVLSDTVVSGCECRCINWPTVSHPATTHSADQLYNPAFELSESGDGGGWGRNFSKYWLCTVACENLQRDCMQAYTSELHEQNLQSRNRLY